ncbi:TetR family transcriptional regulator [Leptolyngbya cf. ectocarpi LEGE 11479]|uniref:TetR family transcriptional regulator n=1 Tax=Leptolyngbya cf. ectocarpi LEGE 11479 TaxID=1828722 RepID=A0A928ZUF4_LEPEC|nr:TetR/AcrR family transcriptional regulator [Leptolyngbya ectocarpi]MBE9067653.1 TetR family transcriptional regulator [Leptolyngbya cf. ectocarpi LEGE 11479]
MAQSDRRLEVSEAAWRVIVREGLDRTSMRAIAQEMSCTTGVVTHYFRNKQELILFALHQVTERLQGKMEGAIANLSGTDRLVAMLLSFLPLDQERQEILRVWVAFLGYAVGREGLMADHQQNAGELRQVIIQELVTLQSQGDIRPDVDPEQEANGLLALVNGVALDTLIQTKSLSREQQEAVLQRHVDGLCPKQTV